MKLRPLLCELHSHSNWSDGELGVAQLVDLYGRNGFDVLAITDHVLREDDPWAPPGSARRYVHAANYAEYLEELAHEAARAQDEYDLLLLPGLELSYNAFDPRVAGHALAVGLREFVDVDEGLEQALTLAAGSGAALIAAHPSQPDNLDLRRTGLFASDHRVRELVHRFELFNRNELFDWVARQRLPAVATGDFHRLEHLATWKTLLPCEKREEAVVAYLRSAAPAFLAPLAPVLAEAA
jgi:predicted metal-dependent phosphoesterase TrpH